MRVSTLSFYRSKVSQMMMRQSSLNEIQLQMSTGKKIQHGSEDVISSTQSKNYNNYLKTLESYQENIENGELRLGSLESSVNSMLNVLDRANELITFSFNGTLNDSDRNNVSIELTAILNEMVNLANIKDQFGEYMFSGLQANIAPYQKVNGDYTYQGDQGQRLLNIAPNVNVALSESGFDLFENVNNGNGTFLTTTGPSVNTGSGVISPGNVISQASYVEDVYTISFVTNSSGNLAYQVMGAASGQVVPPIPAAVPADAPDFVSAEGIEFNGMSIDITGEPAIGDDFQIEPSQKQNLFTALQNVIDVLQDPINNDSEKANLMNALNQNAISLEQGHHKVIEFLAEIGVRGNVLEREGELNSALTEESQIVLSRIEDVDYTETVVRFNQELFALEAAQQSFVRLQQLSIFNYL